MTCDCGARLRRYAAELIEYGIAESARSSQGGHAVHDAAHYLHAATIAEGRTPTVRESLDVTIDTEWLARSAPVAD